MKNRSNLSKIVFVSSVITSTVSHEDLEGFCSVVLPEYPTNWGVDITSFIECVCEDSHTGNGQTLVVCQYEKSGNNNESSGRHTGIQRVFDTFDSILPNHILYSHPK